MPTFPIDNWLSDMHRAAERIMQIGRSVLETHRKASDYAAEDADHWKLDEHLKQEHETLIQVLEIIRQIISAIGNCQQTLDVETSNEARNQSMQSCAEIIEKGLPEIENAFATIRHAALDLLLWTERSAKIEGSSLPREYRESYAQLTSYAPIFDPFVNAFREELLSMNNQPRLKPEAQRLISALAAYTAAIESARIRAERRATPMELLFQETKEFLDDLDPCSPEQLGTLATEVNDCCQLLLYDPEEFRRRVEHVQPPLAMGIDASLVVLTVSIGVNVVFTVDEDPLFEQIHITLLRALAADEWTNAKDDLLNSLYEGFSSE